MPLLLATRTSALALAQSRLVVHALQQHHPGLEVDLLALSTTGDALPDDPLTGFSQQGVFTRELDRAVLEGIAHLAVHSLKDLPTTLHPNLTIAAIPPRANPFDTLLQSQPSPSPFTLHSSPLTLPTSPFTLHPSLFLGTSSPRRRAQLLAHDPSLLPMDLRGNVPTRIDKLRRGDYDAIILARAGLDRLALAPEDAIDLPADVMLPAPGQGALAIVIRKDDTELANLLHPLHDPVTAACVHCERRVLSLLGGGCHAPVATLAEVTPGANSQLRLQARSLWLNGAHVRDATVVGPVEEWQQIAAQAAEQLRDLPPPGPLDGVRVVVTRDEPPDGPLATALRELGALAFCVPLTATLPPTDPAPLKHAAARLAQYDWILVTSQRALQHASHLFNPLRPLIPTSHQTPLSSPLPKVACVGNQTASALRRLSIEPAVVADEGTAHQLVDLIIRDGDLTGARFLHPTSNMTDPTLSESLRAKGAAVDVVEAYRTETLPERQQMLVKLIARHQVDAIVVASRSAARAIEGALRLAGQVSGPKPLIGSLGPATSAELARLGWPATFESPQRSFQSLADAMAHAWTTPREP